MGTALSQVEVFYLEQPSTALAKDLNVNLGFRPQMVWVINYKAAGRMAVAVDGLNGTVNGGLDFGRNAAMAAVGAEGIFFIDGGIQLKENTNLIKENDAKIIIIAFRSLLAPKSIDLSDAGAKPTKLFDKDSEELYEIGVTTSS